MDLNIPFVSNTIRPFLIFEEKVITVEDLAIRISHQLQLPILGKIALHNAPSEFKCDENGFLDGNQPLLGIIQAIKLSGKMKNVEWFLLGGTSPTHPEQNSDPILPSKPKPPFKPTGIRLEPSVTSSNHEDLDPIGPAFQPTTLHGGFSSSEVLISTEVPSKIESAESTPLLPSKPKPIFKPTTAREELTLQLFVSAESSSNHHHKLGTPELPSKTMPTFKPTLQEENFSESLLLADSIASTSEVVKFSPVLPSQPKPAFKSTIASTESSSTNAAVNEIESFPVLPSNSKAFFKPTLPNHTEFPSNVDTPSSELSSAFNPMWNEVKIDPVSPNFVSRNNLQGKFIVETLPVSRDERMIDVYPNAASEKVELAKLLKERLKLVRQKNLYEEKRQFAKYETGTRTFVKF